MKIGYILAGMVFLFNPHINIIDFLPDVIGYILILHGLSKLSDLERNLLSARQKFLKLAWLSAGKLACLLILPIFDATLYLIFTFGFGLLEILWMIPAFIDLFHGISFLEERYTKHRTRFVSGMGTQRVSMIDKTDFAEGRVFFEVFARTRENADCPAEEEYVFFPGGKATICASYLGFRAKDEKKTPYFYESAEARVMSIIFVIIRALCACLPEVTALLSTGDSYVQSRPMEDYDGLRYILELGLAVIALIVGVIWLVRMVKYFRTFMKDTPFLTVLSDKYEEEITPNRALWVKRKTLSFCLFASAAFGFLTCIRLSIGNITSGDGKLLFVLEAAYLIPEFCFGIFMIFAFRRVREFYDEWKNGVKKAVLFSSVSFASFAVLLGISIRYGRMFRPYEEWQYLLFFALYLVIFSASMVLFFGVCREKEKVYLTLVKEIGLVLCPDDNEYAVKRRTHMAAEFQKRIKHLTLISLVYAAFSVFCMAALPFAEEYVLCGLSWLFRSAFCIFVIVKSVLLTDRLQHEIEKAVD